MSRSSLTRWKLEGDGEAIVWTRTLWPLQLGVERVQDVELHGFEEAVTLVFKYNRHHNLTAILQVSLDVVYLNRRGKKKIIFSIKDNFLHQEILFKLKLPKPPSLYFKN